MVLIFTNEVDADLTGLVKKVNGFVNENKKYSANAFVVFLGKKDEEIVAKLKKLARDEKIDIPLTINAETGTAKKFQLNEKVKSTILVYKKKKVEANFALNEIAEKDIAAILEAAKAVTEKS